MKVRLVAIIVVALGILYWGVHIVSRDVRRSSSRIVVVLPSADGVREGAAVSYLGLSIGVVDHLEVHGGGVVVEVRIQRDDVDLRRGDAVRLKTLGILGDRQLEIVPGPPSAPPIGPGDTLYAMTPSPR